MSAGRKDALQATCVSSILTVSTESLVVTEGPPDGRRGLLGKRVSCEALRVRFPLLPLCLWCKGFCMQLCES